MSISRDLQRTFPGTLVTLFQLDLSRIDNGPTLLFTPASLENGEIVHNGMTYTPVDIEATGFEWNGQGAFPTPTLRLSNVDKTATALVNTYRDLVGAEVRRIRTLSQYLDNGATPDPGQLFSLDMYRVEQKLLHTRNVIEWKLSAAIDQEGVNLPAEMMTRDYCARKYRRPKADGTFDYSRATCRYAESVYFDKENNATADPKQDYCPKLLSSCKLRFGDNAQLPFKGYPGIGKTR